MNINGLFFRLVIPMSMVFLLSLVFLAFYIPSIIKDNAISEATRAAEDTVGQYKILRSYYTKNVVKKVLAGSDLKGSFNHKTESNSIPLPATLIHDLSSELNQREGTQLKLYSKFPFPNRASRQLDDFQREAWNRLSQSPKQSFSQTEEHQGKTFVRVAVADTMAAEACVNCHNNHPQTPKNDWRLGDVRGVLEVSTPIDNQLMAGQAVSFKILLILVLLIVVMVVLLWQVFRLSIDKPVKDMSNALSGIVDGGGDLSQRLIVSGENEISELAIKINSFFGKLEDMVKQLKATSVQLVDLSSGVLKKSAKTASHLHNQQGETQYVVSTVTEMTASAREVAANAAQSAENTRNADTGARSSRDHVQNTRASIEQLVGEMTGATEAVQQLASESVNIGSVLDVIRDIADQTNLLALNAAIEAARAGEQGRGFAVVADEVRSLASRTQTSTDEIQKMIESLQNGSTDAVKVMHDSSEGAQRSVDQVAKADDILHEVSSSVSNISGLNDQIEQAAGEQTSVADDINDRMVKIASMADESVAEANAIADQAQQLSDLTKEMEMLLGHYSVRS